MHFFKHQHRFFATLSCQVQMLHSNLIRHRRFSQNLPFRNGAEACVFVGLSLTAKSQQIYSYSFGAASPPCFFDESKLIYLSANSLALYNMRENITEHIWANRFGIVRFGTCKQKNLICTVEYEKPCALRVYFYAGPQNAVLLRAYSGLCGLSRVAKSKHTIPQMGLRCRMRTLPFLVTAPFCVRSPVPPTSK